MINGNYNEKCDIWACGVIMYILYCGQHPFQSDKEKDLITNILNDKVTFGMKYL